MYCSKCGVENTEDAKLCSACGEALAIQPAQQAEAKTSGLAITSLVLGILSTLCSIVTALPAIIFGIVSLVKINNSDGRLKGKGLAIAGISVSTAMLVIFVVAMLLAILMPALGTVKERAQRLVCATNMKGLAMATVIYANDSDGKLPTADKWCDLLITYAGVGEKSFCCRNQPEGSFSYALNKNITSMDVEPDTVLFFESDGGRNAAGGPEILAIERHKGEGCNVGFVDGHVQFVKTEDFGTLKWMPETTKDD